MAKYSEAFKLDVVQSYASGVSGFGTIAQRYGIRGSTRIISGWQRQYHAQGLAGL